jgi:virginiamycin B lyase
VLIDPATNVVSRRLEVDAVPYSLAEDGDSLWIVDFERSAVLRIDRVSGEELLRVQGIRDPIEIAVGEGGVWVTEHRQGNLVRLDPETGEELARLGVGGRPGVAIGFGSVWARSDDDRVVSRIDPVTNRVVETIAMPGNPVDFAVAGDALWVVTRPQRGACERNSHLVRIDPTSSMPDGIMALPCAFGIATDGRSLWAASGEGDAATIARIDTAHR